jgi:P4 family phage/plasmid primase-like protien
MTEVHDEAFKAIKDSIPPEYDDPTEEQQKAIDALDRLSSFNPNPEVPLVEAVSEAIMHRHTFLTVEETGEIWYYDNGVYIRGGEIVIAKEAEQMRGYDMTKAKLSEIVAHIMRRNYHKHEELDADINIINVKNGLYNIDLDYLLPHSPKYLSVNQKPITHVKDAKPKRFWQFLREVLYPEHIRPATSAMAYTFHRDYIVEVINILLGFGANGKGVFTSILTAIHGPRNVSNVPLSDMLKDTFALSDLEGKDLNIDNELAGQTVKETAVLKRLTGGSRQPIRIQRKNQKAYDTILYAKLFFSANKIPESADTSNAYNRRMNIIPFPNTFEKASADKQLTAKLTTDEEISGIFNVLMAELRRIRRTKEVYVNEKTIEEKRAKYERAVNPVKAFMDEAVAEDSQADAQISKSVLYMAYVKYCRKYALPPEKYDYFCKILKKQFQVGEFRVEIKPTGKREIWWQGITLTQEYVTGTSQERLRPPWLP